MGEYKTYQRSNITFYYNGSKLYAVTKLQSSLIRPKHYASGKRIEQLAHLIKYRSIKSMSDLVHYCSNNNIEMVDIRRDWIECL